MSKQGSHSCGHCNDPKIGDKFNKLTIINIKPHKNYGCSIKCRCDCGREIGWQDGNVITKSNNNVKSCGHCNDPKVGDKFGKLTIVEVKPSKTHGCSVKCKCDCGRITKWYSSYTVTNGNTKSCGYCGWRRHQSKEYEQYAVVGAKYNKLTIIEVQNRKIKCKCDCGNITRYMYFSDLYTNHTCSCGHCNDPKIGDRFGSLVVIEVIPSNRNGCSVKCKCGCGRITKLYHGSDVSRSNNPIQSCGHCNDPKVGDKFGKLTIIKVIESRGGGCSVICQCECGKKWGPSKSNIVTSGNTTSCGNCYDFRNGKRTSQSAIKLHDLVENILKKPFEHNGYINKECFDIISHDLKIIVEFDGYVWHRQIRNRSIHEKTKEKLARKHGYKFLRIRSGGVELPSKQQLAKVLINHFQHGAKKKTITMKSWKDAEKQHNNG